LVSGGGRAARSIRGGTSSRGAVRSRRPSTECGPPDRSGRRIPPAALGMESIPTAEWAKWGGGGGNQGVFHVELLSNVFDSVEGYEAGFP
jgi:hypothetical protein